MTLKNLKLLSLAAALVISLAGCASQPAYIQPSARQTIDQPPADKAQVVFLNPANSIQGAFLVGVYDVKDTDRTYFGMLGPMSKLVENVEPGKHRFMSHNTGSTYAYLLDADLEAGKRYYVMLRFVYGRGLQLRPVKADGSAEFSPSNPKFHQWVVETKLVDQTPASQEWYTKWHGQVDEGQAKAIAEWNGKDAAQRQQLTLNRTDSVAE